MAMRSMTLKIRAIVSDEALDRDQKVDRLMKLHREARAEQRTATESGMVDDDGLNADLLEIDLALERLGQGKDTSTSGGAATL
jgi:hypothetical protein